MGVAVSTSPCPDVEVSHASSTRGLKPRIHGCDERAAHQHYSEDRQPVLSELAMMGLTRRTPRLQATDRDQEQNAGPAAFRCVPRFRMAY